MDLVKSLVGKEVSCTLAGYSIKEGKIIIEKGEYYILQNIVNGIDADNKENYKHSWHIRRNNCFSLKNLKSLNELTQSIELWI